MVTQLEDPVNFVKVMYPQFDFFFSLTKLTGGGGLDASTMNKEYK
jgi:hypothetical protein